MDACQICGRAPAKHVSFKAHQGFLVFRREITYEGTFCRDHSMEAYAAARGASLKGMWFGAASLTFGVIRSLWDSAKLADLPAEVRDSPWMFHFVACPHCGGKNIACSGYTNCERCGRDFIIASCAKCRSVHALVKTAPEKIQFQCRICSASVSGVKSLRNWSPLLLSQGTAEACSGQLDGRKATDTERDFLFTAIAGAFGLTDLMVEYAINYFDRLCQGGGGALLAGCIENTTVDFRKIVLIVAYRFSEFDGPMTPSQLASFRRLCERFGLDFDDFTAAEQSRNANTEFVSKWWIVLDVRRTAPLDEIVAAYKKLAAKHHPDRFQDTKDKDAATTRLKEIITAYEMAKTERQHEREDADRAGSSGSADPEKETPVHNNACSSDIDDATDEDEHPEEVSKTGKQEAAEENAPVAQSATEQPDPLDARTSFRARSDRSPSNAGTVAFASVAIIVLVGIALLFFQDKEGAQRSSGEANVTAAASEPSQIRADDQPKEDELASTQPLVTSRHVVESVSAENQPRTGYTGRRVAFRMPQPTAYDHSMTASKAYARGDFETARASYMKAIKADEGYTFALNGLAWLLSTCPEDEYRNGGYAVMLSRKANRIQRKVGAADWMHVGTLAAALAESGDFDGAIAAQKRSLETTPSNFISAAQMRLTLYEEHRPYRTEPIPIADIVQPTSQE